MPVAEQEMATTQAKVHLAPRPAAQVLHGQPESSPLMRGIRHRLDRLAALPAHWGGPICHSPHPVALEASDGLCRLALATIQQLPRFSPQPDGGIRVEWLALSGRLWVDVGPTGTWHWGLGLSDEVHDATHDRRGLREAWAGLAAHLPPQGWLAWASSPGGQANARTARRGIIFWMESHSEAGQWKAIDEALQQVGPEALDAASILTVARESHPIRHKLVHRQSWLERSFARLRALEEAPESLLGPWL